MHENATRVARMVEQNRAAIAWVLDLAGKALHAPTETLSFDGTETGGVGEPRAAEANASRDRQRGRLHGLASLRRLDADPA
jgi:hypothetical protein